MAPYAASYRPPGTQQHTTSEPVRLILGPGANSDVMEVLMEVEIIPHAEDVLEAVHQLREMDVDETPWWDSPEYEARRENVVAILDTNVLLRHLSLLKDLLHLLDTSEHPRPTLIIPHIVVSELDGLKNSGRMAEGHGSRTRVAISALARRATTWVLESISSNESGTSRAIRGQRRSETLLKPGSSSESNDGRVLDCALYHSRQGQTALLVTDDKNLRLQALVEGLPDAFGIDDGMDAAALLQRLDPAQRPKATTLSLTNGRSMHQPPTPRPPATKKESDGSSTKSPLPRSRSQPIPLKSAAALTLDEDSMEVEPDVPPPPLVSHAAPPVMHQVHTPSDVYLNISIVITQFLSSRIYAHVYHYLDRTRPRDRERWRKELGDWRLWEGADCVRALKVWWEEGDVQSVCRKGLELEPSAPVPSPAPLRAAATSNGDSSTPSRTRTSRWDGQQAPTSCARSPPSRPPPPPPSPASRRARLSPDKRLLNIFSTLGVLIRSLSTPVHETDRWSPPRWEALIEGIGEILMAVLGGLFDGDVEAPVRAVMEKWAGQLRGLGVQVNVG